MDKVVENYRHTGTHVAATFFTKDIEQDSLRLHLTFGDDSVVQLEFYGKETPFDIIAELSQQFGKVTCGPSMTRLEVQGVDLYMIDTDSWINPGPVPTVLMSRNKFIDILTRCLKKQYVR